MFKKAKKVGPPAKEPFAPPLTKEAVATEAVVKQPPHSFQASKRPTQGYGHPVPLRKGAMRMSGHAGAHCIGRKK